MKVILATSAPDAGGVWTHIQDLFHGLQAAGHEPIVALQPGSPLIAAATSASVTWVPLDQIPLAHADVVHFHMHSTFDLLGIKKSVGEYVRRRSAVVITEHLPHTPMSDGGLMRDPSAVPGRKKPAARQLKTTLKTVHLQAADALIAVSESSRTFLAARYDQQRTPMSVIYNGIRAQSEVSPLPGGDMLRVYAVGVLAWRKGFDILVEATQYARRPWTAHVYGTGTLRDQLQQRSNELGGRVHFEGWRDDAATIASQFDVMCLPSRGEAFPYSILEAMGQGRATVGTRVNGIPELIDHQISGLLVGPEDPIELAAALDSLADVGTEVLTQMGFAARQKIVTDFSLEQMVNRTIAVYEQAIARRRVPRLRRKVGTTHTSDDADGAR